MKLYINCCCRSVTKSRLTLCDPMESSARGFPVLHYLPMFAQTHVHWVSDATQPSDPLSLPSPPALNLFSASGSFSMSWFFASGDQIIRPSASSSVLPMNIQGWTVHGITIYKRDNLRACPGIRGEEDAQTASSRFFPHPSSARYFPLTSVTHTTQSMNCWSRSPLSLYHNLESTLGKLKPLQPWAFIFVSADD